MLLKQGGGAHAAAAAERYEALLGQQAELSVSAIELRHTTAAACSDLRWWCSYKLMPSSVC